MSVYFYEYVWNCEIFYGLTWLLDSKINNISLKENTVFLHLLISLYSSIYNCVLVKQDTVVNYCLENILRNKTQILLWLY